MNWLLLLIPVSIGLRYWLQPGPVWVFLTATAAIIPLADWIRRATEQLARSAGPAIGGLLNVTFGNVAELVLALFVLLAGEPRVVKAQITGSLIGNSLLGLGLAILIGSWGRERQTFKRERAGLLGSLLILTVIALLLPAVFDYTERGLPGKPDPQGVEERLSLGVSVVLVLVYAANLLYTLVTHRDVFALGQGPEKAEWSATRSVGVLALATVLLAIESELVSGALEPTAEKLGLTKLFLGVTVLAVVGNAAEYMSAIYFARQNRMGLVVTITVGSTIQVALLLAPVLVLVSYAIGHPMNLVFDNTLELAAIAGAAFAVNAITQDGETTWFEGLLLVSVYILIGLAFFFISPGPH